MVYWAFYVAIVSVLYVMSDEFWGSVVLAVFLFIFFLWPFAMLLDFFVEFLKVIFRK